MVLCERLVQRPHPGQPPPRRDDPDPQGRQAVERGFLVRGRSHSAANPSIIGACPGRPPIESGPVQTAGWRITEDERGPLLQGPRGLVRVDSTVAAIFEGRSPHDAGRLVQRTAGRVLRRLGALEGGRATASRRGRRRRRTGRASRS